MAFDFPDDESLMSGPPIHTPSESTADDLCNSEMTSRAGDECQDDDRPETSPYNTTIFTLLIGASRKAYPIHEAFLYQSPEREKKCWSKPWGESIALRDVDEDIGHPLVHYLYTGLYQTLKPQTVCSKAPGDVQDPTATAKEPENHGLREYRRSVLLYCAARTYSIRGLVDLTIYHIENPQEEIPIENVMDIAQEAFEKLPDDEVWFTGHLKRKLETELSVDRFLLKRRKFLDRIGKVKAFDQALMRCIADIYTTGGAGPGNRAQDEYTISGFTCLPAGVEDLPVFSTL
ncbi:hypothetical protein MMC07_009207 [Pseudocyphellaria aurata]|nr:hypothetical protein [Pseudocyphellaria aurata]